MAQKGRATEHLVLVTVTKRTNRASYKLYKNELTTKQKQGEELYTELAAPTLHRPSGQVQAKRAQQYGYTRKAWLTRPMGGRRSRQP